MVEIEDISNKALTSKTFDEFYCRLTTEEINCIKDFVYERDDNLQLQRNINRMICSDYIACYLKHMIDNPATTESDFNRLYEVYTSAIFRK